MTKKTLEKRSVWQDIKDGIKVAVPVSLLVSPMVTNVGSYLTTNHYLNSGRDPITKEILAEFKRGAYENGNFVKKTCFLGEYLAANKYLKNKGE